MSKCGIEKRYFTVEQSLENGVFLYGAGVNGEWCLDFLKRKEICVLGFIDSNPYIVGKAVQGLPVISYEQYLEKHAEYDVLITSKHHAGEILKNCCSNKKMISFDAWFALRCKEDYEKLEFVDERSYDVLRTILDCMYSSDESVLRGVAEHNQYFSFAPFFNTGNEIYVDLGAYTGDTIEKFLFAQNGGFRKIYAFEPGKIQWKALNKRVNRLVEEWALNIDNIVLVNGGAGTKSEKKFFSKTGDLLQMQVSDHGEDEIIIYSLDSFFGEEGEVSFIKADIEGMEYEALLGAEELIKRCQPKMALSVYHKPDDLIRIYKLLQSWNLEYRFALRHHSSLLMDTTLYCW